MPKMKILMAVKTYPTLSTKYDELVCTAGFTENGDWIRIYPVPFRQNSYEKKFKKYDWIEIDLERNRSDFRPESYKPYSIDSDIHVLSNISTRDNWAERKRFILQEKNIHRNMTKLIAEAQNKDICTSLAIFKPKSFKRFVVKESTREWDAGKLKAIQAKRKQGDLFEHAQDLFTLVKKLPYTFYYIFEDEEGRESKMMIEDWEIGALYWTSLQKHANNEQKALEDV